MKITKSRLNVGTYPYWHHTLDYCLDSIAACGFQNVEFWAASPQYCYADYTKEERIARKQEILAMLHARGLAMPVFFPEQGNMYPLNIGSPSDYIRDHSMQYLRDYIDDAVYFGASVMILDAGNHVQDDKNPDNYKRAVEAIAALCDYAKQYPGLALATEAVGPHNYSFSSNLQELQKLIADVGMDNYQACLSTTAAHGRGETVCQYLEAFGSKLAHVHIADTGSRAIGTGTDAEQDLLTLEQSDYAGSISLDIQFRDCCINPDAPVFASAAWLKAHHYL